MDNLFKKTFNRCMTNVDRAEKSGQDGKATFMFVSVLLSFALSIVLILILGTYFFVWAFTASPVFGFFCIFVAIVLPLAYGCSLALKKPDKENTE